MIAAVIPYLIATAFAFSAGWTVNGWRLAAEISDLKTTQAQAILEGERNASAASNAMRQRAAAAAREAAARDRARAAGVAAARAESDGLRADLSAARAQLANHPGRAGADNADATRALLDVLEQGTERLAREGARIAAAADGHASDALTLRMSWPELPAARQ